MTETQTLTERGNERYRQTHRQTTDRQTDRHTHTQTDTHTDTQTDRQTNRQKKTEEGQGDIKLKRTSIIHFYLSRLNCIYDNKMSFSTALFFQTKLL